ncbi:MAG TPA: ABC transporter ATP-binding protein [Gemmatimonadaceae bacterium]|nr:ABC transporter ATP-binding protein [Gemmatimonadaceae bacterium]
MSDSPSSGSPALALDVADVAKSFGPVRANRGASLQVRAGEIHALVGENGAGKSTLMRILSGMYAPDAGRIVVNGRDVTGWTTADAIAAGVGMVHQHFMLVPTLTVAENVVLGREPRGGGALGRLLVDRGRAVREVETLSRETGLAVDPRRRVAELSVGEAQRVEILKTLLRGARILILDEPTAVLSPPEVEELWKVLRRLRDAGGTIVLITHKLDEVMSVSDTITVMRAGRTVARLVTRETTPAAIARAMVGRDVELMSEADAVGFGGSGGGGRELASAHPEQRQPQPPTPDARPALTVSDLVVPGPRSAREVDGVSFVVAPGEILGVAGVEGNGQTELIEAIAGLRGVTGGRIALGSRDVTSALVRERADAGLAHIPEDRHRRGLVLDYSVADNLILGRQHHFTRGAVLDATRVAANAAERVRLFDVRPAEPSLPARALSGGNQQKVVIAREMGRDFTVLLAAQPTRGVDVGAIEFIHARLRDARAAGKAVLLVSAELNEILALADRVAVMYRGRFVAVLPRSEATAEVLGPYMTGATTA